MSTISHGRLITSDCHIAPPPTLVEQLPSAYRDFYPRVDRRDGSRILWPRVVPSAMAPMMETGEAELGTGRSLARAAIANVCAEADPSFDPAELLADLDRDGVGGAVLIGRLSVLDGPQPAAADVAYCRLVNDWLAETWQPYLHRVAPGIYLPFKDVAASVAELERAASLGLRPALLPDGIYERPYHLPEWEPLWEAAADLGVPITMHVGNLHKPPDRDRVPYPGCGLVTFYNQSVAMGETLGWLTFSGAFERHPQLRVVMTEGYAAWLGFAMQLFDHHWKDSRFLDLEMGMGGRDRAQLAELPSFYLRRQAHATFMWDPLAVRSRDFTGTGCLLWGNDYPHHEGSFPYSSKWIDQQFEGVDPADVDLMVRGNAAALFGIDLDEPERPS